MLAGAISTHKPCSDVERSHWWQLKRLVDYQHIVDTDRMMKLSDKLRHTTAISNAMARIAPLADLEAKILKLEEVNRDQILEFQQAQDRLELEYKTKLEAMRNRIAAGN
jgi:hypothetical protein